MARSAADPRLQRRPRPTADWRAPRPTAGTRRPRRQPAAPRGGAPAPDPRSTVPPGFLPPPDPTFPLPPESCLRRPYPTLDRFVTVDEGGHFLALEAPDLFVAEIRAAFRPHRRKPGLPI